MQEWTPKERYAAGDEEKREGCESQCRILLRTGYRLEGLRHAGGAGGEGERKRGIVMDRSEFDMESVTDG